MIVTIFKVINLWKIGNGILFIPTKAKVTIWIHMSVCTKELDWCKEFDSSPISERPSPIDFNGVKRDLGKMINSCIAYITIDMNGYPEVW